MLVNCLLGNLGVENTVCTNVRRNFLLFHRGLFFLIINFSLQLAVLRPHGTTLVNFTCALAVL